MRIPHTIFALSPLLVFLPSTHAHSDSGALYPPALPPLINRANTLLSLGQFNEAVKTYSEAIEQSPTDYLLYYKRGTSYFSLSRHSSALEDFTKVLSLTSNTFDGAHLMSAKIHARDGHWSEARKALDSHKHADTDKGVQDLRLDVDEGEKSEQQAKKEMQAQLWTACYESATRALRVGAYAVGVREMRSECALRAGDIESAVGDLSRLTHLRGSTTPSEHLTIFRLAYFFLPAPISASQNAALTALKQCLHLDPDSSLCLPAHRQLKALDRGFGKVEGMVGKGDWRGVLDFLLGKDRTGTGSSAFLKIFEDALGKHTASPTPSPSRTTTSTTTRSSPKPLPTSLLPALSPRLTTLLRYLCQSHTQLNLHKRGFPYCERLLSQDRSLLGDGPGEEMDVGDAGKAEYLLGMEEWEEAIRVLEGAWERGRGEDIKQRLQRAQRLLKQSRTKDYYKVLGVSRDADPKTIKKAL
ncbi:hypothetical protein PILCRDRAFT_630521 [Piloderma croceum F 1598]|uniref:TPR-like protein n=1 Tax=Piloderma croceum (strain F 1598) TaxID=765440 RepID=A0A0C3EWX8_PILCF|nr:hypothetical protein PILCRDRAFT_630521 [Piloderma croceum F 1598]